MAREKSLPGQGPGDKEAGGSLASGSSACAGWPWLLIAALALVFRLALVSQWQDSPFANHPVLDELAYH